jgi:Fic family protein
MEWKIDIYDMNDLAERIARLEEKKKKLMSYRPLPGIALQKIKESLFLEWTYNSNSIEGNTLSLNETKIVLEDGMTVSGKSLREHFEITNHHEAIEYLEGLLNKDYKLTERDILDIHRLILKNIEKDIAGRYRTGGVRIGGANFTPPNAMRVADFVSQLIDFINKNEAKYSDVILATLFHHRFVWIHPFFDGNGRTVRLVMNLILMRSGYPPAIILKTDRKKYYAALNQANNGSYTKLALLMIQAIERSLDIYLGSYPNAEEYVPISSIVEEPGVHYGQEYVSLLARQGKIDAYKEGRDWLTTRSAVINYVNDRKRKRKLGKEK